MSHDLPPGFRFHPTDEELILYYLSNQAAARPCPVPIIPELNIYNYDPWELPGKSDMADGEWYFFSPRHRKYPNGARPNRATASGYWKATGTDKAIHSGSRCVGVKKALVFYLGRPPRGSKTEWIMHEYRLDSTKPNGSSTSRVLDEWVLCRIYKKKQQKSVTDDRPQDSASLPRACSLAHLLDSDYISPSQLFEDNPLGSVDDLFDGSSGGGDAAAAVAGIQSGGLLNPKSIFED